MCSIAALPGVDIAVSDVSTFSRRESGLILWETLRSGSCAPIQLMIDTTGLNTFVEGNSLGQKRKAERNRALGTKLQFS